LQGLRQFLTGPGLVAFFDAPWFPVYCLVMFAFHPWFGWICLVSAAVMLAIAVANERATAALLVEAGRESGHAYAALSRTLGNADTIEALGMLSCLRERWRERSYGVLAAQSRASERGGRWIVLSRMVRMTVQSSMLGVGAWLVLENEMTGGLMVAGSILLGRALAPLDQLTGVWKQFVTARERYRRLNELLNEFPMSPPRM
jgi:ATP-binding cassette subfamily C protein EexD